ncbi:MAG: DUF4013 domain-containing protein [Chloroflexi bacterium]|nr:DUF4013 domain-containing protein [Chloroflexota bacterium]
MFFGIDLNQLFTFPFKDAESRKYFLIGCLVALAGFIVPLLPYFVLYGYSVRIAKQIMNDEAPHMVPWDDWEGMFKDGAKMFGIRIIYSLPIFIIMIPLFIAMSTMPILTSTMSSSEMDAFFPIFMVIFFGAMCLIIPISLPLAVIIPAAEIYVVDKNEFAAGFRIREWWAILRANISGFIAAFAIYYISSMVLTVALQVVIATLIFACLLPFVLPAIVMYSLLIMYTTIAQAYKGGKEKLAQSEIVEATTA